MNYPSVDGDEFEFEDAVDDNVTGTWINDPGTGDPAVRFWSAKAGPDFKLFYYTPGEFDDRSMAIAVTEGTWSTPDGKELSHIVFYDSGDFPPVVDEPATLVLMGLALVGSSTAGGK